MSHCTPVSRIDTGGLSRLGVSRAPIVAGTCLRGLQRGYRVVMAVQALRLDQNAGLSTLPAAVLRECTALQTLTLHGCALGAEGLQALDGWAGALQAAN